MLCDKCTAYSEWEPLVIWQVYIDITNVNLFGRMNLSLFAPMGYAWAFQLLHMFISTCCQYALDLVTLADVHLSKYFRVHVSLTAIPYPYPLCLPITCGTSSVKCSRNLLVFKLSWIFPSKYDYFFLCNLTPRSLCRAAVYLLHILFQNFEGFSSV